MTRWSLGTFAAATSLAVGAWWWTHRPSGADDARRAREARVAFAAPQWTAERVSAAVAASDHAAPGPADLRALLADVTIDDRDLAAFHAANIDAFGGRPLAESRYAAEQLWRVHLARRELGVADPENGLVYPEDR